MHLSLLVGDLQPRLRLSDALAPSRGSSPFGAVCGLSHERNQSHCNPNRPGIERSVSLRHVVGSRHRPDNSDDPAIRFRRNTVSPLSPATLRDLRMLLWAGLQRRPRIINPSPDEYIARLPKEPVLEAEVVGESVP